MGNSLFIISRTTWSKGLTPPPPPPPRWRKAVSKITVSNEQTWILSRVMVPSSHDFTPRTKMLSRSYLGHVLLSCSTALALYFTLSLVSKSEFPAATLSFPCYLSPSSLPSYPRSLLLRMVVSVVLHLASMPRGILATPQYASSPNAIVLAQALQVD